MSSVMVASVWDVLALLQYDGVFIFLSFFCFDRNEIKKQDIFLELFLIPF